MQRKTTLALSEIIWINSKEYGQCNLLKLKQNMLQWSTDSEQTLLLKFIEVRVFPPSIRYHVLTEQSFGQQNPKSSEMNFHSQWI